MNDTVFVHPSSYVDDNVTIGSGTKIWHFSHIMSDCVIGDNCILGQSVFIASGVTIGNNVKIQNNVSLYTGMIVEDDVFLGPSCVFTNVFNPRAFIERKDEYRETVIQKGASIGANATVVCGHTIGKYAFVGAGSVVTKDVSDFSLVYGVPAQNGGYMCKCGNKLDPAKNMQCEHCGAKYRVLAGSLTTEE